MSLIRQCEEYIHDANDLRVLHTREEARCEHHGYVDKTSERFMQRFFYPVHVTGRKNVQALAGIQIRLLSLKKVVAVSNEDFKKEITITQGLVKESVKIINRFVKECENPHEN